MSIERERRIRDLFLEALEQPEATRSTWVGAHSDDDDITEAVLTMLADEPAEEGFLEPTPTLHSAAREAGFDVGAELGDYRIVRPIGRGGTGVVFLAEQVSVGRLVALKVFPSRLFLSERDLARLANEARTIAKLEHPHVITIHDVVRTGDHDFFVMQYVDGHDLSVEIRRQRLRQGLQPGNDRNADDDELIGPSFESESYCDFVADLIADTADALEHAHRAGIVHRDIKPPNLMLDKDAQVKVGDFGIARDAQTAAATATSEQMGTLYYMSPEQIAARGVTVDHRTDVYSLGVVLYELLTLRRPFDGDGADVLARIPHGNPTPIEKLNPRVDSTLRVICAKAMAVQRQHRYDTAGELHDDLRRYLAGEPIAAHPPSLTERMARWLGAHRVAALVAVIAVMGAAWLVDVARPAPRELVTSTTPAAALMLDVRGAAADEVQIDLTPIDRHTLQLGETRPAERDDAGMITASPGVYRVAMSHPSAGFCECDVTFHASEPANVTAWLRRAEDLTDGMVDIAGGRVTFDGTQVAMVLDDDVPQLVTLSVDVAAFAIDASPVTIGQYRAYVEATGATPPVSWSAAGDETWDDLPVTSVSHQDASNYAAWAGKRLPTVAEWLLAARGPTPRRFPWGDDARDDEIAQFQLGKSHFAPFEPDIVDSPTRLALWSHTQLRPVTTARDAAGGPNGLNELIGLVGEWTSTFPSTADGGSRSVRPLERVVIGTRVHHTPEYVASHGFALLMTVYKIPQFDVGFRCVRSLEPRVTGR